MSLFEHVNVLYLQFIIDEFEHLGSSRETFWAKYTDHEKKVRLGYEQILVALKAERKLKDPEYEEDVKNAKQYFGGDLSHPDADGKFIYKRSNKPVVRSNPKDIARIWRGLLRDDPVVAERWAGISQG